MAAYDNKFRYRSETGTIDIHKEHQQNERHFGAKFVVGFRTILRMYGMRLELHWCGPRHIIRWSSGGVFFLHGGRKSNGLYHKIYGQYLYFQSKASTDLTFVFHVANTPGLLN